MANEMKNESPAGVGQPVIDWGLGRYEPTAAMLLPAAKVVVERAAPRAGETVIDLGCGTGNAAILAAERGASVTGVDPTSRLLDVARSRANEQGLDIAFVEGTGAAIPVADAFADAVLSVFAVIFAPDPVAAVNEMVRVTAPGGQIVVSDWLPGGALMAIGQAAGQFIGSALGMPPPSPSPSPAGPSFAWHDRDALAELFAPHGYTIDVTKESLACTAESADRFMDDVSFQHPAAVGGIAAISHLDNAAELETELRSIVRSKLDACNEDPSGFLFTADYVVITASQST